MVALLSTWTALVCIVGISRITAVSSGIVVRRLTQCNMLLDVIGRSDDMDFGIVTVYCNN